jgi:hypothetical protein
VQEVALILGGTLVIAPLCCASWCLGRRAGRRAERLRLADKIRGPATELMALEQDKKALYGYSADIDKLIPNGPVAFTAEGGFAFSKGQ